MPDSIAASVACRMAFMDEAESAAQNQKVRRARESMSVRAYGLDPRGFWMRPGGGGGIRTHDRSYPMPVFKTGAFNRSATPPGVRFARARYCKGAARSSAGLRAALKDSDARDAVHVGLQGTGHR